AGRVDFGTCAPTLVCGWKATLLPARARHGNIPDHGRRRSDSAEFCRCEDDTFANRGNHGETGPRAYDITPDGKSFIVMVPKSQSESDKAPPQINISLNWFQELKGARRRTLMATA